MQISLFQSLLLHTKPRAKVTHFYFFSSSLFIHNQQKILYISSFLLLPQANSSFSHLLQLIGLVLVSPPIWISKPTSLNKTAGFYFFWWWPKDLDPRGCIPPTASAAPSARTHFVNVVVLDSCCCCSCCCTQWPGRQRTLSAGHAPTGGCVAQAESGAVLHCLDYLDHSGYYDGDNGCVHLSRHLILPAHTFVTHSSFLLIELILIYKHTTPRRSSSCVLYCNPLHDDDSSLGDSRVSKSRFGLLRVYTLRASSPKKAWTLSFPDSTARFLPLVLNQLRSSLRLSNQNPASLQRTLWSAVSVASPTLAATS